MARQLKPRPRGAGTFTESGFWGMIRSYLRRKSMAWKPMQVVKEKARRPSKSENKRLKWEYQCTMCKNWHPDKDVIIDHIIPAGTLTCGDDLKDFVERLFCEADGLRVLCNSCHRKVTNEQLKTKKKPNATIRI